MRNWPFSLEEMMHEMQARQMPRELPLPDADAAAAGGAPRGESLQTAAVAAGLGRGERQQPPQQPSIASSSFEHLEGHVEEGHVTGNLHELVAE